MLFSKKSQASRRNDKRTFKSEKIMNETHLLKIGEKIIFGTHGLDYVLENCHTYTVEYDNYTDEVSLKEAPQITLPEKLYVPETDEKFINKVITHFKHDEKTTGVMLAGTKGSGKTVMAKQIALRSHLPIVLIDKSIPPRLLRKLFTNLSTIQTSIIFDEIDKLGERYDDDYILQILDGVNASGKHLILFTCNDPDDVNEYLLNRCGRVRYYREFDEMGSLMITEIAKDRLNDKKEIESFTEFVLKNFKLISFDNVASFIDEVNNYPTDTFEELFKDMNIESK